MPAILTQKYRTLLAQNFARALSNTSLMTTYLFIGRPQEWVESGNVVVGDSNPPIPKDTAQHIDFECYRDMVAAKRITADNVAFVVTRTNWTANTVYSQYDDTVDMSTKTYFVLDDTNLPYKVYKCVWNNKGAASTIPPSVVGTALTPTGTADGYVWQYMYTITTDYYKFLTSTWMPVLSNSAVVLNAQNNPGKLPTAVPLVIESPGSNYNLIDPITVTFTGDGSGAAVSNTGVQLVGGKVSTIVMSAGGSDYTQITGINVYQSGATTATVRAIIPPYPNHGYDPIKELGVAAVMITTQFTLDESGKVTVDNNFRRIGLLINPTSPSGNVLSGDVLRLTTDITISANTGAFNPDDVITNVTKTTNPSAVVVDVVQDVSNNYVIRTTNLNIAGETTPFSTGDTISCLLSGVEGTVSSVDVSDIMPYSGSIIYVNQRTPVTRQADQSEGIKLILPFK